MEDRYGELEERIHNLDGNPTQTKWGRCVTSGGGGDPQLDDQNYTTDSGGGPGGD